MRHPPPCFWGGSWQRTRLRLAAIALTRRPCLIMSSISRTATTLGMTGLALGAQASLRHPNPRQRAPVGPARPTYNHRSGLCRSLLDNPRRRLGSGKARRRLEPCGRSTKGVSKGRIPISVQGHHGLADNISLQVKPPPHSVFDDVIATD